MAGKKKPGGAPAAEQPSSPKASPDASSPSSARGVDLLVGDTVEIFGLNGAKELNGRRGTIVTFVRDTQRFGVKLDGDDDTKETKAVKPVNLKRLEEFPNPNLTADARQRCTLERELADVMQRMKNPDLPHDEASSLKSDLTTLVSKLKRIDEAAKEEAAALEAAKAKAKPAPAPASPQAASPPAAPAAPAFGPRPPPAAKKAAPEAQPQFIHAPPPLPREQHNPLPAKQKEPEPKVQRAPTDGRAAAAASAPRRPEAPAEMSGEDAEALLAMNAELAQPRGGDASCLFGGPGGSDTFGSAPAPAGGTPDLFGGGPPSVSTPSGVFGAGAVQPPGEVPGDVSSLF